jgi:dolichyl-phosphate mannosyltransferase polypeptide 2 regulatory subunit
MLVAASVIFLYYSIWALVMVSAPSLERLSSLPLSSPANGDFHNDQRYSLLTSVLWLQPFVDDDHVLQNFFPPRVWAIRIPVIIILLGSAVVGSFIGMVMIRSTRKKAAKAKAAAKKKA